MDEINSTGLSSLTSSLKGTILYPDWPGKEHEFKSLRVTQVTAIDTPEIKKLREH